MNKKKRKGIVLLLVLLLAGVVFLPYGRETQAATPRLNRTNATLAKGKRLQLKVSGTNQRVKWSTSNKKIATVNEKGVVKGRSKGAVRITAKIGKKKLICKVTIDKPKLDGIRATVGVGKSVALKLSGTKGKTEWFTSDNSIAIVSQSGVVTGIKQGNCRIYVHVSGTSLVCMITVTANTEPNPTINPTIPPRPTVTPTPTDPISGKDYKITYQYLNVYEERSGDTGWQAIVEVQNTNSRNLYLGNATFDIYSQSGSLVASENFISDDPSVIAPGEKGYFFNNGGRLDVPAGQYVFKPVLNIEYTTMPAKRYPVSGTSIKESIYGSVSVLGTVTNNSADDESMLWIAFVLFGENDEPIGVYGTNILDLKAGQSRGFEGDGLFLPDYVTLDRVKRYEVIAAPFQMQFN